MRFLVTVTGFRVSQTRVAALAIAGGYGSVWHAGTSKRVGTCTFGAVAMCLQCNSWNDIEDTYLLGFSQVHLFNCWDEHKFQKYFSNTTAWFGTAQGPKE